MTSDELFEVLCQNAQTPSDSGGAVLRARVMSTSWLVLVGVRLIVNRLDAILVKLADIDASLKSAGL